jgi:hypothetical protein
MKKGLSILFVMVLILSTASVAMAKRHLGEDTKRAAGHVASYTGGVIGGTVNTVGGAVYGVTKTVISPIKAFWRSIIGKGKPQTIVTAPINEAGETIKDATVNTGKTVAGHAR